MNSRQINWIDQLAKGGWLNALLTAIAGASLVTTFAPFHLWYLVFPGLIWLILPLQSLNSRQTLLRGMWFNLGFFSAGISWVHISVYRFGNVPLPLSIPLTALLIGLLSLFATLTVILLNRYFSKLEPRRYFLIAFPLVWIFMEWVGGWFFTGFPWFNLGHGQVDGMLSAIAPFMGSTAISFVIVLIAGLTVLTLREGAKVIRLTSSIFLVLILAVIILQQIQWVKATEKTLSVSLIQPSIPQQRKWLKEEQIQTLEYFQQVTEQLDSQLVVWPEGAVPALERQVDNYLQRVSFDASQKSQAVLTGIPVLEQDKFFNAAIMLGEGQGRYYKQHLVPFGEYVPLESKLRGLIGIFDLPMSSFSSGDDDQPLLKVADWSLTMALCYEIIFQDIVANQLPGAEILVTLSNDAWFGASIGAYQHLGIARMRALENGIPVIRATNDGISALIDHQGKVQKSMGKFEKGVLSGVINGVEGQTLYRQLGPSWSYFIILSILVLILVITRSKA
ncbi:MAG: apolipoprotein N-acyltransferase [Gammaproteobacteria bacterium]|nr:MAG: apolipoprotein N-acyltransferase [Gammaproteobacteria bacterium]